MPNIYFASDFHLGAPDSETSLKREKKIVKWLDTIKKDAQEIYLLGDTFDFWFEYKTVIPKGYIRLLGKLAELTDAGIPITVFTGNHDFWMYGYFEQELNITVHHDPIKKEWNGKKFMIGHGDGLGPKDKKYKLLKKIFTSNFCQWLFARLHPNFGIKIARFWSKKSRMATEQQKFSGENNEWLLRYAKEKIKQEHIDYFIFGHRHLPLDISLNNDSRYINLGDWITHFSYAIFDGKNIELKYYEKD